MKVKNKKIDPIQGKQQWGLFFKILISFAILFLILGGVIYFFFRQSIYQNIDSGLNGQKTQIKSAKRGPNFRQHGNRSQRIAAPPANSAQFRTTTIIYNSKGRVLNAAEFAGGPLQIFTQLRLNKKDLNQKETLTLYSGNSENSAHYFRKLLVKVPKSSADKQYAGHYVLLLVNIDSELLAINSFRKSLMITLIAFWVLAIGVAYYLSRQNMKPILRSWKRQQEFSSNAAHELRTPLTIIQNQMEYLLTKPRDQIMNRIDEIGTTLDEVKHMRVLSERLLMLARSDSGMVQLNKQEVTLKPWLEKTVLPYEEIAGSQNKSFVIEDNVTGTGKFDADLIKQLLVILLDNALKYTPSGGTITCQAVSSKKDLTFRVYDTGTGIPDKEKDLVFERFYRTDRSRNSETGGNGLGLPIAKWIVTEHHGKITIGDNYPAGSVFKVVIPLGK
ncbi:two-component system sensor histidine kinase [Ligilactobacillus salitolerans]|uniref:histidine kinase n=1 Tax=Ligilactobacillus salitolerans TaxID=1808352 RepID=A0A401IQF9_9LACO|nr:HAMP domain-containing sensor histidine kinase [Ligilactobacillus salitolerans]GBG93734.1 two-component system sensor histidine kinase [Ligilactobacillus salitolerans]